MDCSPRLLRARLGGFRFRGEALVQIGAEKAAKKACAVGDFQKGVDILADLFVETDDPGWIYNQGVAISKTTVGNKRSVGSMSFSAKPRIFREANEGMPNGRSPTVRNRWAR